MKITEILKKEDLIEISDRTHQLGADEFNAIVDYLKVIRDYFSNNSETQFSIVNNLPTNQLTAHTSQQIVSLEFTPLYQTVSTDGNDEIVTTPVYKACTYEITAQASTGGIKTMKGVATTCSAVNVNIRNILVPGLNNVTVTVAVDGLSTAFPYTVQFTSLSITENELQWYIPYTSNTKHIVGGFNITGDLDKTVVITVTGVNNQYSRKYEDHIGTAQYTTRVYSYEGLPQPTTTGLYTIDVYVKAGTIETNHITYDMMYIRSTLTTSARLVSIRKPATTLYNMAETEYFQYAIYNGGKPTGDVTINTTIDLNGQTTQVSTAKLTNVSANTANTYHIGLDVDTDIQTTTGTTTVSNGNTYTLDFTFDNANAFPPVSGYDYQLNPLVRSNKDNPTMIPGYPTENADLYWTNMCWLDGVDGWTVDQDGRKALVLPAGSKLTCGLNNPFFRWEQNSATVIDLTFKSCNVSDYSNPIIDITNKVSDFVGIRIKPTNIEIRSYNTRDGSKSDAQSYNFEDEQIINMLICLCPRYKNNLNYGLIYANGVKKCIFTYDNMDSFNISGDTSVIIGNSTADVYLYSYRVYNKSFDATDALNNYYASLDRNLNRQAYREEDEAILADGEVDFAKIQSLNKYNYFIVEPINGGVLPGKESNTAKDYSCDCNFEMHYPKKPEWDYYIKSGRLAGQGSTSMNYYIWNLRVRTDQNTNTTGTSHLATQVSYNGTDYTASKTVKIVGQASAAIKRITAKKNFASSMQSHKMGSTAAYNDLHDVVCGANEAKARTAVFQYPAYGFMRTINELGNEVYRFIGLYTIGPDKGDKTTFGYDNSTYKSTTVTLEGTNHSPLMAVFRYPWNSQVACHPNSNGDLMIGIHTGGGQYDDGWEIGNVCGLETDQKKTEDFDQSAISAAILLYWKPAYEVAYKNSPFILGVSESIATINSNVESFRMRKTSDGRSYSHFEIWDSNYDLYYYNLETQKYTATGVNVASDLGISTSSLSGLSLAQKNDKFVRARVARFKTQAPNYWNIDDALFHYCFCLMFGATDNFAKNTYPYTFGNPATTSARWRWRQDDLDTIFDIDNQGKSKKPYSIEFKDWTDDSQSAYMFKGEDSAFWTLIYMAYDLYDDTKYINTIGQRMINGMAQLASSGLDTYTKCMLFFDDYYWAKAQHYFTRSAYNADAMMCYEDTYPLYVSGAYNVDVNPLEQALGDHYESEHYWVSRRLLYCMSKFRCGTFSQYTESAQGRINFRTQVAQSFTLTPAIDMYISMMAGENTSPKSSPNKVTAGTPYTLTSIGGSNTNVYIMGADYLEDIGDFSKLTMDAASQAELGISAKRLRLIKVGDAVASNVTTKLASLTIGACLALELLDARNLKTLGGTINLSLCKRIKEVLLTNTAVTLCILPDGCKIERLLLPASITTINLTNLPQLNEFSLQGMANLRALWAVNVKNVPWLKYFVQSAVNNDIKYGLHLEGLTGTIGQEEISVLYDLAVRGGGNIVDLIKNQDGTLSYTNNLPSISGKVHLNGGAEVSMWNLFMIKNTFTSLDITYDDLLVTFDTEEINDYFKTVMGLNRQIRLSDIQKFHASNIFGDPCTVKSITHLQFTEFEYFTSYTTLTSRMFVRAEFYALSMPSTLKTINTNAIVNCGVAMLRLNEGLETIQDRGLLLSWCSGIVIPSTLKSMSGGSIIIDDGPQTITVDPTNEYFEGTDESDALIEKATGKLIKLAMSYDNKYHKQILPEQTKIIGSRSINKLQQTDNWFVIPEGVTEIQSLAFTGCKIPYMVIPNTIKTIHPTAVDYIDHQKTVVSYATTPPTNFFKGLVKIQGEKQNGSPVYNLYVPSLSISKYQTLLQEERPTSVGWMNIKGFNSTNKEFYKTLELIK